MSKRRRKQGPIREERDRKPNPYWIMMDEDEHEMIEDAYDEESDAESVSGRQEQEFNEEYRKILYRKSSIRRSLGDV